MKVSWLLDTKKGALDENHIFLNFVVCKGLSSDVSPGRRVAHRVSGDTAGGTGFKTCDFVHEKLEGLPLNGTLLPQRCWNPSGAHRSYNGDELT